MELKVGYMYRTKKGDATIHIMKIYDHGEKCITDWYFDKDANTNIVYRGYEYDKEVLIDKHVDMNTAQMISKRKGYIEEIEVSGEFVNKKHMLKEENNMKKCIEEVYEVTKDANLVEKWSNKMGFQGDCYKNQLILEADKEKYLAEAKRLEAELDNE